jgi:predicted MFS family arabinose efflux permease
MLGKAFGVHRAMDSAGALLGPLVAVALLSQLPGDFASLWIVSFIAAILGLAALWLFVPARANLLSVEASRAEAQRQRLPRRFKILVVCGTALALVTVSDGFVYLLLQQKSGTDATFVPLFFVVTAASYMLFSVPVGVLADRVGRIGIFTGGYAVLAVLYVLLFSVSSLGPATQFICLSLLGLYYAGTEGVLMAAASSVLTQPRRATGLAIIATCIGLAKLASSLLFGWSAQSYGMSVSVAIFGSALLLVLLGAVAFLRVTNDDR